MKRKVVSSLIAAAMLTSMLAGCGNDSAADSNTKSDVAGSNSSTSTGSDSASNEEEDGEDTDNNE